MTGQLVMQRHAGHSSAACAQRLEFCPITVRPSLWVPESWPNVAGFRKEETISDLTIALI